MLASRSMSLEAIGELLLDLFANGEELRRVLTLSPLGRKFVASLPGGTASLREVAYETVVRLEQAGALSEIVPILVKHASKRRVEIERACAEALVGPTSRYARSNLPRLNSEFVGRHAELEELKERLNIGMSRMVHPGSLKIASLHGMPGVGKSTLALKYAVDSLQEFSSICWVDASCENITAGIARLAIYPLQLALPVDMSILDRAHAVRAALGVGGPHLLILDNVDEPKAIDAWLPNGEGASVLITTRLASVPGVHSIRIIVLPPDDALQLLQGATNTYAGIDLEYANTLCQQLGYLPFAVAVAGSLIRDEGFTPWTLIKHMTTMGPIEYYELLRDDNAPFGAGPSLVRLFDTSVRRLHGPRMDDTVALAMLKVGGWFASAEIPRAALQSAAERLLGVEWDDVYVDHALMRLTRLNLAQRGEAGGLSFHRLIQAFARHIGGDAARSAALDELSAIAKNGKPDSTAGTALEPIQIHLEAALEFLDTEGPDKHFNIPLMLGYYYRRTADYQSFLRISTRFQGRVKKHWMWRFYHQSGQALAALGEFDKALQHFEQAYRIHESVCHPVIGVHSTSITLLHSIGRILQDLGKYEYAWSFYQRAFDVCVVSGRERDVEMIAIQVGFGQILHYQERYDEARQHFEGALEIIEAEKGPLDWHGAVALEALGRTLYKQKRYAEALAPIQRALVISEATMGPAHPQTAAVLHSIGMTQYMLGHLGDACRYLARALVIRTRILGPQHSDTVRTKSELKAARSNFSVGQDYLWESRIACAIHCVWDPLVRGGRDSPRPYALFEDARLMVGSQSLLAAAIY